MARTWALGLRSTSKAFTLLQHLILHLSGKIPRTVVKIKEIQADRTPRARVWWEHVKWQHKPLELPLCNILLMEMLLILPPTSPWSVNNECGLGVLKKRDQRSQGKDREGETGTAYRSLYLVPKGTETASLAAECLNLGTSQCGARRRASS